jgi:hypothetical protein
MERVTPMVDIRSARLKDAIAPKTQRYCRGWTKNLVTRTIGSDIYRRDADLGGLDDAPVDASDRNAMIKSFGGSAPIRRKTKLGLFGSISKHFGGLE